MTAQPSPGNAMATPLFDERKPSGLPWTRDGWKYFIEACDILVNKCGTIQLAVEQEWGGRSSKEKLDSALDDFIDNCKRLWESNEPLHRDTAEVYWEEVMDTDFNCDIEGNETQLTVLARALEDMYDRCAAGSYAAALELILADERESAAGSAAAAAPEPAPEPEADPDGFIPVASKKRGKKAAGGAGSVS